MSTVAQAQHPTPTVGAPRVLLNNRCKSRGANIEYITTKQGPDNQPTYTCEAQVNGTTWGNGSGGTKRDAVTAAAADALRYGDESGAFDDL